MRRILLSLWSVGLAALLLFPATIWAHAYMGASSPAQEAELKTAPQEIRMTFTEKINGEVSQATLRNDAGKVIPTTKRTENDESIILSVPNLANGVYHVEWQILSEDTHVTEGSFRFAVGVALPQVRPAETKSLDDAVDSAPVQPVQSAPAPSAGQQPPSMPAGKTVQRTAQPVKPGNKEQQPKSEMQKQAAPAVKTAVVTMPGSQTGQPDQVPAQSAGGPQQEKQVPKFNAEQLVQEASTQSHDHMDHMSHMNHMQGNGGSGSWSAVLRAAEILAASLAGGVVFLRAWPAFGRQTIAPALTIVRMQKAAFLIALPILILTGASEVLLRASKLTNDVTMYWDHVLTIFTSTATGTVSWVRPLLAAVLAATAFWPKRSSGLITTSQALLALGLLITLPITGHAMSGGAASGTALRTDVLHVAFAAVWVGGLVGLTLLSFATKPSKAMLLELRDLMKQFSRIAIVSVAVVVLSGVILSLLRFRSPNELIQTGYGIVWMWKIGLFGAALCLAAYHRFILLPEIDKLPATEGSSRHSSIDALAWGIRVELLLALAVLVTAGILSTTSPPGGM
ncbi:MAG: CopD family protein [Clostridia bacterium]